MSENEKTLRDEIAIAAMQGMLSSPELLAVVTMKSRLDAMSHADKLSEVAYYYADSMLKARNS